MKRIAVYLRVSSKQQDQRSQEPDLKRWVQGQGGEVVWYRDRFTGRTMERPGMSRLLAEVNANRVGTVVVWRLDRLGRTARGLTALFEDLRAKGVNLVSLKDGLDLSTPAGRLAVCRDCEHHTGLRCRVCGCFTKAKAKLPEEDCPLGKWPT